MYKFLDDGVFQSKACGTIEFLLDNYGTDKLKDAFIEEADGVVALVNLSKTLGETTSEQGIHALTCICHALCVLAVDRESVGRLFLKEDGIIALVLCHGS